MEQVGRQAWSALAKFVGFLLLCIFVSAGTVRYVAGWVYAALFTACVAWITWYLQRHDPALLRRRMAAGPGAEKERTQRTIQSIASVAFAGLFVVAGLDHRYAWSAVPNWVAAVGDVLLVLGLAMVFLTFRENSFTSGIVEVAPEQRVVDTGPYARVRHPMYAGALLFLLGTPLALESWWALVPFALLTAAIVVRLVAEERLLARTLPGYDRYLTRVKYRLAPGIW